MAKKLPALHSIDPQITKNALKADIICTIIGLRKTLPPFQADSQDDSLRVAVRLVLDLNQNLLVQIWAYDSEEHKAALLNVDVLQVDPRYVSPKHPQGADLDALAKLCISRERPAPSYLKALAKSVEDVGDIQCHVWPQKACFDRVPDASRKALTSRLSELMPLGYVDGLKTPSGKKLWLVFYKNPSRSHFYALFCVRETGEVHLNFLSDAPCTAPIP